MKLKNSLGTTMLSILLFSLMIAQVGSEATSITITTERSLYHFTSLIRVKGNVTGIVEGQNSVELRLILFENATEKLVLIFEEGSVVLRSDGTFSTSFTLAQFQPKNGLDVYILEARYADAIARTIFEVHNNTYKFVVKPDREKYTAKMVNGTLAGYTIYDGPDKVVNITTPAGVTTHLMKSGSLLDKNGDLVAEPGGLLGFKTLKAQVMDLKLGKATLKGHYSIMDYRVENETIWLTMGQHVYAFGTVANYTGQDQIAIIIFKPGVPADVAFESIYVLYTVWALGSAVVNPVDLTFSSDSINVVSPLDPRTTEGVYTMVAMYEGETVTAQFEVSFRPEDMVLKPEDLEGEITDEIINGQPVPIETRINYDFWIGVVLAIIALVFVVFFLYYRLR